MNNDNILEQINELLRACTSFRRNADNRACFFDRFDEANGEVVVLWEDGSFERVCSNEFGSQFSRI
tara:strand:+ start:959 stop:1156 length:198 start_codon:yes stop_codon:yes gene_type:complete